MTHEDERTAALAQGNLLGEAPGSQPLRAKWEAFALAKVEGLNNTQAAIKAGFSRATAATKGSFLNRKVEVRLRVESLRQLVRAETVKARADVEIGTLNTLDNHLDNLAKLRDMAAADKAWTAATAAEIGRGKALGFHADRLRPEDLEAMGEEELKQVAAGKPPRLKLA